MPIIVNRRTESTDPFDRELIIGEAHMDFRQKRDYIVYNGYICNSFTIEYGEQLKSEDVAFIRLKPSDTVRAQTP